MRVCLVSRELAPFFGGGIAGYVVEMARALHNAGHEVHVLTHPHDGLAVGAATHLAGIQVHAVRPQTTKPPQRQPGQPHTPISMADVPGAFFCHATWCAMAVHEKLLELHHKHPFDYIETPDYRGEGYWVIRAARTLNAYDGAVIGVRLHTAHHIVTQLDHDPVMTIDRAHIAHMERSCIASADLVLSASHAMLRKACDGLGDDLQPDAAQLRAVVRLPMHLPQPPSRPTPSSPPTVLYIGRIQRLKGVDTLTAAAVKLLEQGTSANFLFVGADTKTGHWGGSMLEQIRRGIPKRFSQRFEFRSAVPRSEIPSLIDNAAVCVFPSRFESFSYACVEAMSRGAAVVVSDGGSLPELVKHELHGLVFNTENTDALAANIKRLLTDHHLADRLRNNAVERATELCEPAHIAEQVQHCVSAAAPMTQQRSKEAQQRVKATLHPRKASTGESVKPVTVIIPHYNIGDLLEQTIDSLRAQTYTNFKTLIIDDGSTDKAAIEAVARIEKLYGIPVLRKPNGGLGSARNAGFNAATTPYVISFDADDIAEPDLVETLLSAIAREPDLAFCASMFTSFNDDKPDQIISGYVPLALDPNLIVYHNIAGPGSGTIYNRQSVLDAGGYDETMTSYEDWELWCRLASKGYTGVAIPRQLFRYRIRVGSLLRTAAHRDGEALRATIAERYAAKLGDPSIPLRLAQRELAKKNEEITKLQDQLAALKPNE